ncbi:unnamed protein product [Gadus morhua 'NCC']
MGTSALNPENATFLEKESLEPMAQLYGIKKDDLLAEGRSTICLDEVRTRCNLLLYKSLLCPRSCRVVQKADSVPRLQVE